ncbi:MAG: spore maturation protein [Clostridia bacterium]|nr:spore maturation protein [Clostridia bacterium]
MSAFSVLREITAYLLPVLMGVVGLLMLSGKRSSFDTFVRGAREGLETAVRLLPTLTALLVAIGMLNASGVVHAVSGWLAPIFDALGVPGELLPLLLSRPFSGSAATATYSSLLRELGADSFAAACASVIMGSSDTAVYVITVYFSSIGVKHTRYALPLSLGLMVFCIFLSCFLCRVCLNGG